MCKKLPIPVVETIKKRHSVRTYVDRELAPEVRQMLVDCMNTLENPFGVEVKKYIIDKRLNKDGEKLGTYGVIRGAGTFLGISIPDVELAPLAAGYEFENLILYATSIGLGTVWLAATFNRSSFATAMGIRQGDLFPAISPVGYPAKRSIAESLMRTAMRSSSRKEWHELFFTGDFATPLTREQAGEYATPLEMLRLAPSATNSQPWRVVKVGDLYHFYAAHKPGLSQGEKLIKRIDMGIALSHFHQTAIEMNLPGHFEKLPQDDVALPANIYYIISWRANRPNKVGGIEYESS